MCRGLAVGYNTKTAKMICSGLSHHTETLKDQEDDCVKLEIIINDNFERGYVIDLDEQYKDDTFVREKFKKYINLSGSITSYFNKIIESWIFNNEIQILRWLLVNKSYAISKGNTDNRCQKTKGDTYNSYQETVGNIYINNIKNFDTKIDTFIKKITKENDYKLTWKILVKLAIKGYSIK